MKFITRELYDDPHPDSNPQRWNLQGAAYRAHLASIRCDLPDSMQTFCDISLHDSLIKAISQPHKNTVQLDIDASRNPWGPTGQIQLVFAGVKEVSWPDNIVGEWWLYSEVHLHTDAGFDYRVLLTDGEFHVVADDVRLIVTPDPISPPQ